MDIDIVPGPHGLRVVPAAPHHGPPNVCEQHPELDWPHGDCSGPGCPPEHRAEVLAAALLEFRLGAAFGHDYSVRWLQRRGIAEHTLWKGPADA